MTIEPLVESPGHTIGPFFHVGLRWEDGADVARADTEGRRITLLVRVLDRDGEPIDDCLLETWQADAHGRYASDPSASDFVGFSRTQADADGCHAIRTIVPGPVPGPGGGTQAPHLAVSVFARGLMRRLVTRVYLAGEPGLGTDPVLALVPAERRDTLLAHADVDGTTWRWDIRLRGEGETVFFDI